MLYLKYKILFWFFATDIFNHQNKYENEIVRNPITHTTHILEHPRSPFRPGLNWWSRRANERRRNNPIRIPGHLRVLDFGLYLMLLLCGFEEEDRKLWISDGDSLPSKKTTRGIHSLKLANPGSFRKKIESKARKSSY